MTGLSRVGSGAIEFVVRFVLGGLLIAVVPVVARSAGANIAGLLLLAPVVTLVGLVAVMADGGKVLAAQAALSSIRGLPAVAAFLATFGIALHRGMGGPTAVFAALSAWVTVAVLVLLVWGLE